jgi:uncharacterized caspase-like protein
MRPRAVRRWVGLACAAVLASGLADDARAASRRFAFVLGNAAYAQLGELPNPAHDAAAIAAALAPLGFDVDLRVDLSREALTGALPAIAARAREADLVAFFYAGHGVAIDNQNYIVPVDARLPGDQSDLAEQVVALARVMDALEGTAKATLIILDSCRNNPYNDDTLPAARAARRGVARGATQGAAPPARNVGRGLARMDTGGAGMFVAFATKPGEFALDAPNAGAANSPFTGALVHHIATPNASLEAVMIRVRREVQDVTERRQLPWSQSSLVDEEIFLNGNPWQTTAAAPTPAPIPAPAAPSASAAPPPVPPPAPAPTPSAEAKTVLNAPPRTDVAGRWLGKVGVWELEATVEHGELTGRLVCRGSVEGDANFRFRVPLPSNRKIEVEATSITVGQIAIPRSVDVAGTFPELTVLSEIKFPRYRQCKTETIALQRAAKG